MLLTAEKLIRAYTYARERSMSIPSIDGASLEPRTTYDDDGNALETVYVKLDVSGGPGSCREDRLVTYCDIAATLPKDELRLAVLCARAVYGKERAAALLDLEPRQLEHIYTHELVKAHDLMRARGLL